MKPLATRILRIVLFAVGILMAATLFAFGCEALQLGPFIPTETAVTKPAFQAGIAMLALCSALLFGLFQHFLE